MSDANLPDDAGRGLLPAGLGDVLPPGAAHEAAVMERLVACFAARGYERVKPPLVEFEDSLLDGPGAAMRPHCFRLMDPVSQRMMGVRPDITPQVARIARTRLAAAPRPLRLSYAGDVLRVRGGQLRPERQFVQVGAELVGAEEPEADAEVAVLAASALAEAGVKGLSVDLGMPTLVPKAMTALGLAPDAQARARFALDRKDAGALKQAAGGNDKAAALLGALLRTSGPADAALPALAKLDLPAPAAADRRALEQIARLIRAAAPRLALTVDVAEARGFEYETGVTFAIFARGVPGELGRGGRYRAGGEEPAVGVTLYMDTVSRALPAPVPRRAVYLPHGTLEAEAERLRAEGWITLAGLAPAGDARAEAKRLGCTHALKSGKPDKI